MDSPGPRADRGGGVARRQAITQILPRETPVPYACSFPRLDWSHQLSLSRVHRPTTLLLLVTASGFLNTATGSPDDLVRNETIRPRWIDAETIEFTLESALGTQQRRISATSGRMLEPKPDDTTTGVLIPRRAVRSQDEGRDIEVEFTNELTVPLRLTWLDREGRRRPYGVIAPGKSRRQHTFPGHAWILIDPEDMVVTGFVAGEGNAIAVADADAVAAWRELEEASMAATTSPPPKSPVEFRMFTRQHDLWCRDADGTERRITTDGEPDSSWGRIKPSPDGRFALAMKTDHAEPHPVHMVEVAPGGRVQPRLKTINYLKPGDRVARARPAVFELATGRRIDVDPDLVPNPWSIDRVSWHPAGDRVRMLYNQRGHQILRYLELDVRDGSSRVLIEESSPTFVDYAGKTFLHVLAGGDEALWMSERSGWNHLERVDLISGERRSLTEGPWVVRAVDDVDEQNGRLRMQVLGIDPTQDPYHVHHAMLDLDSGEIVRLTEGDGTHRIDFSPDGRFYVDRWSRVDLPPVHELRRTEDGGLVAPLAKADASGLIETGWTMPERFVTKGRDGETDIWGVIVRPRGFQSTDRYPVVEHIYAGPHSHFVPKSWSRNWRMRDAADLGTVVVQIDGMGTNWRSKSFHDVAWRNLGDSGFPDRIAWMKEAAETRPWMDLDRVGIYGGSAGGQSALRALLAHGDFYDVAVADCGCHDNRMDKIWWNELWMGWPIGDHYVEQSNVTQAHRLEGELMLVLGGMDTNVDPASTLQVVDALVKADKDFEFVLLPSAGHGAAETPYGHRRRLDFLRRKLVEDR